MLLLTFIVILLLAEEYSYTYDVAYVLGTRETKVDSRFIKLLNDDGTRKRSTMGRCKLVVFMFAILVLIVRY